MRTRLIAVVVLALTLAACGDREPTLVERLDGIADRQAAEREAVAERLRRIEWERTATPEGRGAVEAAEELTRRAK